MNLFKKKWVNSSASSVRSLLKMDDSVMLKRSNQSENAKSKIYEIIN